MMVEMRMREVDVDIERRLARQFEAEGADARAGIEDQPPAAGGDFQARRIAAIARVFRRRNRKSSRARPRIGLSDHRPTPRCPLAVTSDAESTGGVARVNRGRGWPAILWPQSCVCR